MRATRVFIASAGILGCAWLSLVACGGSEGTTAGSGDGAAGSGEGGATNGDGSSSSNAEGGTSGNGTDGSTTSSGGGDAGFVNGPTCPATAPNNQSMCKQGDGPCAYGNAICDCGGGGGNNPVWTCTTCPACPSTQPTGNCMTGGQVCAALNQCNYGATQCSCNGGQNGATWVCGMCPATQPTGMCTTQDLRCNYGTTNCQCRRNNGMDTWECQTPPPPCPSTQPAAGSSCVQGTGMGMGCDYANVTCHCFPANGDAGDEWSCN
jgi:hypothetical protein